MSKFIFLLGLLAVVSYSEILQDQVDCFRMQDSEWGHYVNCSCTKPLPLKVETTFTLQKDYYWSPYLSYSFYLTDGSGKKTSINNCFKGTPSQGNKTAGTNLTLSITCNSLPRQLQQFDMIQFEILFPDLKWLTYGVPIPGYTTIYDVQKRMQKKSQIQNVNRLQNKFQNQGFPFQHPANKIKQVQFDFE